jgi:hypothetical protein
MMKLESLFLLFCFALLKCQAFISIQKHTSTLNLPKPYPVSFKRSPVSFLRPDTSTPPRTKLGVFPDQGSISTLAKSLFSYSGNVPLLRAFGLNAFLFTLLRSKLLKMLTREGFFHALFLGTALWTTLGWRGWSVCVAYLFLGSAVTKVRFAEKEKMGIAESRGGRRGPENIW